MTLITSYFAGETFAQRAAETCRYGNESRYSRKAERHDVSQNLYSETRECKVRRILIHSSRIDSGCLRRASQIGPKYYFENTTLTFSKWGLIIFCY